MDVTLQTNTLQCDKPKLSRASTHKVRTGCITCKRRHIKCDEAKPHCSNCLRGRGHCEGYATKAKKNVSGPVQIRWDSKQGGRGATPRTRATTMPLQVDPDSVDFRNSTALGYFQEFVRLVQGPWINAASNDDLWEATLPQLARTNDVLRSAALAIGALSMWHRQSGCRSLRAVSAPVCPTAKGETHYFHAVAYYCHSIKLQSKNASLQDAVFLSLLFLFFERLRGNRQAALDHLNHGLTLLFVLFADKNSHSHVANSVPNPKPVLGAVADIFTYLATQVRTTLRGRIGQGPSLPNLARKLHDQKYTIESFMLLLSELPRSVVGINEIPTVFTSLDQFQAYWFAAGRRRQTKIISIMAEAIQTSIPQSKDQGAIDGFFFALLGNPQIKEFCEHSRKEMQVLDAAFLPLFNQIMMSDAKSPEYLRAIHFRLQYFASYVIEDPTQGLDVETLRSQTPLFREFLSLAEIALRVAGQEVGNPAHQLSLQCGLAWYLVLVAFFCRDPLTRDEAVWILRDYPGQDGLWNTHSLYLLALRNRDIERANALEGSPAEQWQRLWRREFVFEDCGSRIVLRYLEKGQLRGEWELIEEVAEVRLKFEDVHWKRRPLTGSGGLLMGDLYSS